jgi:hypothetical protein
VQQVIQKSSNIGGQNFIVGAKRLINTSMISHGVAGIPFPGTSIGENLLKTCFTTGTVVRPRRQ